VKIGENRAKKGTFATENDRTAQYIFFSIFFRHQTFPNNILGILIERTGWILFRQRVTHTNVVPGGWSNHPPSPGLKVNKGYTLSSLLIILDFTYLFES